MLEVFGDIASALKSTVTSFRIFPLVKSINPFLPYSQTSEHFFFMRVAVLGRDHIELLEDRAQRYSETMIMAGVLLWGCLLKQRK